MTTLRETVLRRLDHADERDGPELLILGLYALSEPSGKAYEIRGTDAKGHVHYRFRDQIRINVQAEYDDTLSDLESLYKRVGSPADT